MLKQLFDKFGESTLKQMGKLDLSSIQLFFNIFFDENMALIGLKRRWHNLLATYRRKKKDSVGKSGASSKDVPVAVTWR